MDSSRLDMIAKALVAGTSRRRALSVALVAAVGGVGGALGLGKVQDAFATSGCLDVGEKCSKGSKCCSGFCGNEVCMCPCGQVECSGSCVSLQTDPHNCGACGNVCPSGICADAQCVATCTDGVKNGNETDTDCGGPDCPPCALGQHCLVNSDCQSGYCSNHFCATPTCSDAVKNGRETDVDCGGPDCPKCADGKMCLVNSDCQSGRCMVMIPGSPGICG
jgi:hypothetical protein